MTLMQSFGGFAKGSVPMWGVFALALLTLLARFTPVWRKLSLTEIGALKKEMAELREKMVEVSAKCTAYTLRVGQLQFGLELALTEIEARIPESKVPAQIRHYLAAGQPDPQPSGITQEAMDKLRAVQ